MRNTIIISIFALLGFMACQEEIQQVPMAQAVTGLEVSDSTSNAVTLKWTMGENTEYVLVSYSRAGEQETVLEEKITKETYTVEGLTYVKDSPYEFTVVSYNSDDIAGGSAKVKSNVVMPARDIPAVTFLSASNVSQTTATFKWGHPKGVVSAIVNYERDGDYPMKGSEKVQDRTFTLTDVQPDDENPIKVTVISCDEEGYEGASSSIEVICGGTKNYGEAVSLYQVDPLVKVLRGQFSDGNYVSPVKPYYAQGETASVQFVVLPKSNDLTGVTVDVQTFVNASGQQLSEPKGGWVEFVESQYNGEKVSTNLNGGYLYPDVIIPQKGTRTIGQREFGTYWYDVLIPMGTAPGEYTSVITVSGTENGEAFSTRLVVRMEVTSVVLEESDLLVTNWLFEDRYRHANNDVECSRTNDPETFYKLHKLFANTCRDLGQNTYRMDQPMSAMYPRGVDENGKYKFDFRAFDENVEFLIKEGGLKCIEGSHLCTAAGYGGDYGLNMFYWYNEEKGAFERMGTWSDFEDPEVWAKAEKHITDFFQALQEHLREKGWLDMYVQHIGDEPTEQPDKGLKNWPSWVKFAAAVKKAAPEIKLMDAVDAGCADKISPYIDIMCPVLHVRLDEITLPNGKGATREYCHHNGAVCVIPICDNGDVLCVRQFRYPFGEPLIEIPAGKLDSPDENPDSAVRRELREETGAVSNKITYLGQYYGSPAILDERIYMYMAEDLSFGETDFDEDEFIEPLRIPLEALVQMVLEGKIRDGKTQIAALRAFMMLKQRKDAEC